MRDPYRLSPMPGSTLVCLGAVFIAISTCFYFDDIPDKPEQQTRLLLAAAFGWVLWIAGSMLLAKARFSSLMAGFLCGLGLVPGLIALLTMVRVRSRQQIWQQANPTLTARVAQRQYRDVKSLY